MKKLLSGLEVDAELYYKLLDWKDTHHRIYNQWLKDRGLDFADVISINLIPNIELYNDLLEIAGIK